MLKVNRGDHVRVKQTVEAYYSRYGGNPLIELSPDVIGVAGEVKVPYVRRSPHGDYFVCVDFHSAATGRAERAGVAYGNLVVVDRGESTQPRLW